jgi:tetratricopeptide (TPR) repeat protein
MEDSDTIDSRIEVVAKRRKIYFFLGWPMLAIGMGILFLGKFKTAAVVCIVVGVVVRLLYYFASSELKSLEKYGHLMNKTKLLFFLSFICFTAGFDASAQLKRGDDALEFSGLEWVEGDSFKLLKKGDSSSSPITVLEFWGSWDKASQLSLPLLSKVQKRYGAEKLTVLAVTKEKREKLDKYLESVKKKFNFRIAVDSKGGVTKEYLGDDEEVPVIFIIDNDGEVLWRGKPLELETVLDKVFKGTFNPGVQEEISSLHDKLQVSLQMEKIPSAIRTIDKIMELDPSDALAMRIRLYIFERSGKLADALSFIDQLIEKSPDTSSLYFVKLDLMNRLAKTPDEIESFCGEIFDKFNDFPDVLERLAWIAVFRMPPGTAPLEIALDAIDKAVGMFIESENQNPAKLADYLETQGRVYYMIGKIAKALEIQERVVRLRKGDKGEVQSVILQKYYNKALELSNR